LKPGEDFASSIGLSLKPYPKSYMKKLNRIVKTKEDTRAKKITMVDKYRKLELPINKAERTAATSFMKGSNAGKANKRIMNQRDLVQ
jgi:hypothetical protein